MAVVWIICWRFQEAGATVVPEGSSRMLDGESPVSRLNGDQRTVGDKRETNI